MIEVNVKTIWQGKVAIREKYYWLAKTKRENLLIKVKNDVMIIPFQLLLEKVVTKSEKPVIDKFSDPPEYHYLIYFDWKPTTKQEELF